MDHRFLYYVKYTLQCLVDVVFSYFDEWEKEVGKRSDLSRKEIMSEQRNS